MARSFTAFLLLLLATTASFRADADDRIKTWIDGLKNGNGVSCCDESDGFKVDEDDVVYDVKEGRYRVQIRGQWYFIGDKQLLSTPNLIGRPIVWYTMSLDGTPYVFCFLPGAGI